MKNITMRNTKTEMLEELTARAVELTTAQAAEAAAKANAAAMQEQLDAVNAAKVEAEKAKTNAESELDKAKAAQSKAEKKAEKLQKKLDAGTDEESEKKSHRKTWTTVISLLMAFALAGHLVWCLSHHMDDLGAIAIPTCMVCKQTDTDCNCYDDYQLLKTQNATMEQSITVLEAQLEAYEEAEKNPAGDGICSGACTVHCPTDATTCTHEWVRENTPWHWTLHKTAEVCRVGDRISTISCKLCGQLMSEPEAQSGTDYEHDYDEKGVCKDCGYSKAVAPVVTPKPTEQPVVTNKPTSKPTPTQKPTSKPTPTQKPTSKPTACPHSSTEVKYGEWSWTAVGSKETCQEATREIRTVCKACDAELNRDTEKRVDADHRFDGRTCVDCGYKKPLTSASGKAEGTIEPPKNSWEYEDDEVANPVP